jgi:hypothetical protein
VSGEESGDKLKFARHSSSSREALL